MIRLIIRDALAKGLRDGEYHTPTKDIVQLRLEPHMASYREVLGRQLSSKQRALLRLALSFFTWRTLVHESQLKQGAAIEAIVQAVVCEQDKHSQAVT